MCAGVVFVSHVSVDVDHRADGARSYTDRVLASCLLCVFQLMSITAETALEQLQIPDMNEEMMQSLHSLQSTLSRLLMPNLRK